MKTKISNSLVGLLVSAYMGITVLAILFEKGKKRKKKIPNNASDSITSQTSVSPD